MEKRPMQYTPGFEFILINNLHQKDEEKAHFASLSFGVILYRSGSVTMLSNLPLLVVQVIISPIPREAPNDRCPPTDAASDWPGRVGEIRYHVHPEFEFPRFPRLRISSATTVVVVPTDHFSPRALIAYFLKAV